MVHECDFARRARRNEGSGFENGTAGRHPHARDGRDAIMPAAYQVYSNLFTMTKYNGESLTTWEPRGKDQAVQLAMAKLGPHIVNVHILSNLEPFRYGDTEFIRKSVQARATGSARAEFICIRCRIGTGRIRRTSPIHRNCNGSAIGSGSRRGRDMRGIPTCHEHEDHAYWISRLADFYGNTNAAEKIFDAYNFSGEVAPRLIRRFGITEGNRQTLSLGMTLDQLVNPIKYGAIEDLWLSQSPPGERLDEFVKKEWNHKPHIGETPDSIIADVLSESSNAVAAADAAEKLVTKNRDEFERLRNDTRCIQAMARKLFRQGAGGGIGFALQLQPRYCGHGTAPKNFSPQVLRIIRSWRR